MAPPTEHNLQRQVLRAAVDCHRIVLEAHGTIFLTVHTSIAGEDRVHM
jgi:hypothetical protein